MHQCWWLLNSIRNTCKDVWNLEKMCIVDEMMVRYKRKYCQAREYMPKKLIKWGLKLWCLASANSKFIQNFEVYFKKSASIYGAPQRE